MSFCWLVLIFQQLPGLKRAWPSPVLIAAPSQAWLVLTAVTWSGTAAAPPLEQVAWRKVLTAFRQGLSVQGQSTSNTFRATQLDL